jgi:hypothetical protein
MLLCQQLCVLRCNNQLHGCIAAGVHTLNHAPSHLISSYPCHPSPPEPALLTPTPPTLPHLPCSQASATTTLLTEDAAAAAMTPSAKQVGCAAALIFAAAELHAHVAVRSLFTLNQALSVRAASVAHNSPPAQVLLVSSFADAALQGACQGSRMGMLDQSGAH